MIKAIRKQLEDAGIDPEFFDFVSQMAHFFTWYGLALTVMLVAGKLRHRFSGVVFVMVCCVVYAVWHEFFWDPVHENAETRGSDWEDFFFLVLGGVAGTVVGWLFT